MKKVLVTGGAGFIGSHTVVELFNAGYEPVILDNFSNSDRSVITKVESIIGSKLSTYEGNFQDEKLLAKIFSVEKPDNVIHFAAYKSPNESLSRPLDYYENNVEGLIKLLKIMQKSEITNLVFSSSAVVYGQSRKMPLTEKSPTKPPPSPYGATKQMGEIIIKDSAAAHSGLKAVSLRYFNPIGAHPSGLIGERPSGAPANLVPFMTEVAARIRPVLNIFGNDYPTKDGTCVRDFIHVVDLARAHVKALDYLLQQRGGFYDVFNVGTGKGTTVLDAVKEFQKATGQKLNYKIAPQRKGDIVVSYASAEKAKSLLGWEAEKTLSEALADAWRWQQTLGNIKDVK